MAEFVNEIPESGNGGVEGYGPVLKPEQLQDFTDELRQQPGKWARWPRTFPSLNAAGTCRSNVRRGRYASFQPPEEFEIVQRGYEVYVRFVGKSHVQV